MSQSAEELQILLRRCRGNLKDYRLQAKHWDEAAQICSAQINEIKRIAYERGIELK